ncbi:NAD(P)/FAD-dependent oxidoreductase [Chitinivibrio alkaliphilus]|uniref:Geranylgeranyl reductase n=1 Tax=Chitinivibrio alkaliphilus ACht1 TaxID=1313304 RepID=U7D5N7_9BACT|nr:NAD(P)/FAD-dependent oxidoreductase [Chitinivibrio alkaliphilus]ERP30856.1 geranylgeranyl reductase [Chitinivibrio alkaliphilus ACht1]
MEKFDIAIIGAGPAGLAAVEEIRREAPQDATILLIEKNTSYQGNIRCGEGVWKNTFDKCYTPRSTWIRNEIRQARFFSPNGSNVVFRRGGAPLGYILNRAVMQEDILQEQKSDPRVTLIRGRSVVDIIPEEETRQAIYLTDKTYYARAVIDASGPLSSLGTRFGFTQKSSCLDVAAYALVENVNNNTEEVQLHRHRTSAHHGYLWSFPVSSGVENVGVAWGNIHQKPCNIKKILQETLPHMYPHGTPGPIYGGVIPVYTNKRAWVAPGYFQCGDTAEMVNALTKSGIFEAMITGAIAGKYALLYATAPSNKKRRRSGALFQKHILRRHGRRMQKGYKARLGLYGISDADMNNAISILQDRKNESISMKDIIKTVVSTHPRVYLSLRHFL